MFVQYLFILEVLCFRVAKFQRYTHVRVRTIYKQMVLLLHNDNDLIISGVMNGYKGPVWFIARALSDLATHFTCQQLAAKQKKSHNFLTKLHP